MANDKGRLEIGHVLFIDIVGYSKLLLKQQSELQRELNEIVSGTSEFRQADSAGKLIRLPTGDGMALVFRTSPEAPAECAIEIAQALKSRPSIQLRMGIHSGPVNEVADVNQRANIAGAGINMAQRVMECGDAGHILLSKHVAEDLEHDEHWRALLHDLGTCEVKHGMRVGVANLFSDEVGNPQLPKKFQALKKRGARVRWGALAAALFVIAAGVAAFVILSRRPAALISAISERSIAVLPFENLSDDKANAYFVAGMQDEILTALAKVSALKVISKTSTAKYSSRPDSLKTIARELGVMAILEGSVQRAGEAVHINVQLINGRDDTHVWAESYDRELKKVFEVEREVAETVAGKLKAQLSPQDTKELSRVPTTNPQACDRYLKGEYARNEFKAARANSLKPAIELFKEAITLDPRFALAYTKLADSELRYDEMEERSSQMVADGRTHLAKAFELEPDLIEAHLLQAIVYWLVDHDLNRALAEAEPLLARAPNDARVVATIGGIQGLMGDWQGQLGAMKRAIDLDPRNPEYLAALGTQYIGLRRYREGIEILSRVRALEPEDWVTRLNLAETFMFSDRLAEAREEFQKWPDDKLQTLIRASKYAVLQQLEVWNRNYDAALALTAKIPDIPNRLPTNIIPVGNIQKNTDLGFIQLYRGDKANAEQAFTGARTEIEGLRTANVDNADFYRDESFILAGLGQHAEAVEAARKATTLSKENIFVFYLSEIYAHFGDADPAFETMQKLIDKPDAGGELCAAALRHDPIWDPIRKDPRFEKAIASLAAKESK
jgi:TolB-like protein